MQQCHNFKDPGVQIYGGKLFKELQNTADDIFCKLPPPKPSNAKSYKTTYTSSGTAVTTPANITPVTSMSTYYDAYGSCFNGEGLVAMADGSLKAVKDLIKGDIVAGNCQVVCLTKTKIPSGVINMVDLNGLLITPWHPVKFAGKWTFPIDIAAPKATNIDYVYNLVLNQGPSAIINGVECITLGHGIKGDEVASHTYFGTTKVIQDLSRQPGWVDGLVVLDTFAIVRDPITNLVTGILTSTPSPALELAERPSIVV